MKPIATGFALATFIALSASSLFAQQVAAPRATSVVPRLINFRVWFGGSDGKPLTGTVGVPFSVFKDQEGGAPLWFETQNVQAIIPAGTRFCWERAIPTDYLCSCSLPVKRAGWEFR